MDRKYFLMLGMVLLGSGVYLFVFPELVPLAIVCEIDDNPYSDTFEQEVCVYRRDTSVPVVDPDDPYLFECPTDYHLSADNNECIPDEVFTVDDGFSLFSFIPVTLIIMGFGMVAVSYFDSFV